MTNTIHLTLTLPLRFSKRQSLTTILFKTTLNRTITQYELLILLGSNHLLLYIWLLWKLSFLGRRFIKYLKKALILKLYEFINYLIKVVFISVSKRNWFCTYYATDWLIKVALIFHPTKSKAKTNCVSSHLFSRSLHQLHEITSSLDWLTVKFMSFDLGD